MTLANHKCFEIPAPEDEGLDMEVEFADADSKGTGKRIYLQLKAGNSHLRRNEREGAKFFYVKNQSWVQYWLRQAGPVLLVIGTFPSEDRRGDSGKIPFEEIRWMEISEYLRRESENGKKPVKRIEFKGERLTVQAVDEWRRRWGQVEAQ